MLLGKSGKISEFVTEATQCCVQDGLQQIKGNLANSKISKAILSFLVPSLLNDLKNCLQNKYRQIFRSLFKDGTQRKKASEISLPLKVKPSTENLGKLAFGIFILIDGSPEVGVPKY